MKAYDQLIQKLDGFIRKYYLNEIVKGIILFLSWLFLSYLVVSTTEFYGEFSKGGRLLLFLAFLIVNGLLVFWLIGRPLLAYYRLGKHLSHIQAAEIIGRFFPDVSDKLLNTIQLNAILLSEPSNELLLASIEQRTHELRPVPFQQVIDLKKNQKYLRYLLPVLFIFGLVLLMAPSILTDAGRRVIKYDEEFIPVAPFSFIVKNQSLEIQQYENFLLEVEIQGDELPLEVFVETNRGLFLMEKKARNRFVYQFEELKENIKFRLSANKFFSVPHVLTVLPKPIISSFEVLVDYPEYTGKTDERLVNTGDLLVPEGTRLKWEFKSRAVDEVSMREGTDSSIKLASKEGELFVIQKRAIRSDTYAILSKNKYNPVAERMNYSLTVVADQYPKIEVESSSDSDNAKLKYFSGSVEDDYGFKELVFKAEIANEEGKIVKKAEQGIKLGSGIRQNFYYYFDIKSLELKPGEELSYYFEIADNDQVNGSKRTKSSIFTYKQLSQQETKEEIERQSNAVANQLKSALKEVKQLQQDTEKLKRKAQEQQQLNWEDKKLLEQIKNREENIRERLEEAKREMQQRKELQEELEPQSEELVRKQEQLKEMAEKLLNDDLKKLMQELEKLMQQEKQPQLQEKLDELKLDNKDIAKELDRMLEFFKELEVEQKAEQLSTDLEKLAEEQKKLAKENEQKSTSPEKAAEKQGELNKKFDQLQQELKELEEKNAELEQPKDFDELDEEGEKIEQEMDGASGDLKDKKQSKASERQKQAADKMEKLAQKMRAQMQQSNMEQLELDIRAVRQLLENLVTYSFAQEALMDRLKDNTNYSQAYVQIAKEQFKLREDVALIEDSLLALSKRVIQLQSVVNKEVGDLNDHLQKTVEHLSARQTPQARARQQYAMTSSNNLAVMLSELLKQMQQEMAQMKSKKDGQQAQCMKPGNKSKGGSMSKLSQLQKDLNQQLQQMKEGQMPGEKGKQGQKGQRGQQSKEFGEAAAKQEAIRRELQRLNEEYNKDGKKPLGDLNKLAKEMEKTERELVNKILSQETLRRQQDIMTRLLESERAERERDEEERRESESAKEKPSAEPPGFEAYRRQRVKSLDLYRTVTPELNSFYKQKVEQYFMQISR